VRHSAKGAARLEKERRAASRPARPGGGGDGGGGESWLDQVPFWVILGGVGLGLLVMRGGERDVRGGTLVLAGVLLVAAVARLGLPDRRAGMLGSRRRLPDAAAFAVLGACLLVAGLVFPAPA
jgi:Protein of unknown function (DUF3017)